MAESSEADRREAGPVPLASRFERGTVVRALVIAGLLTFALFALPALLSTYWIKVLTSVAIFAVVALGLNLLYGRVGLVSLGQIALLAFGGWVAARLLF